MTTAAIHPNADAQNRASDSRVFIDYLFSRRASIVLGVVSRGARPVGERLRVDEMGISPALDFRMRVPVAIIRQQTVALSCCRSLALRAPDG
jgi:hypothetical protein